MAKYVTGANDIELQGNFALTACPYNITILIEFRWMSSQMKIHTLFITRTRTLPTSLSRFTFFYTNHIYENVMTYTTDTKINDNVIQLYSMGMYIY